MNSRSITEPGYLSRKNSGFSLVEVVLALGISAFALTSIMALLPTGLISNRESRASMEAMRSASRVMADLRDAGTNAEGMFQSSCYGIPFDGSVSTIWLKNGEEPQRVEVEFLVPPGGAALDGSEAGLYEAVVKVFWGLPDNSAPVPQNYNHFVRLYGAFAK